MYKVLFFTFVIFLLENEAFHHTESDKLLKAYHSFPQSANSIKDMDFCEMPEEKII